MVKDSFELPCADKHAKMANMISDGDIDNLAELARLALSDEEKTKFKSEITDVLTYVSQVQTARADTTTTLPENINTLRADEITNKPGEYTEAMLEATAKRDGDLLKIHKILSTDE